MRCCKYKCPNAPAPERKTCQKHLDERMARYRSLTADQKLDRDVRRMYGITGDEYRALLEKQGGVCAICRASESRYKAGKSCRLSVDHDHETGEVRGLLCNNCNRGIGFLKDDADLLLTASNYLKVGVLS